MKYLISSTDVYRVDSVSEAEQLHEELKQNKNFSLVSFGYKYECQKKQGEVIDDWYLATAKKEFNDKKEPMSNIEINYEVD